MTQDSKDKDTVTNGFTKRGVRFRLPTPPSSSFGGDFSGFEIDISPSFITPPLLWDMEEIYGTTKGPRQYSRVVGTIELDDFIQEIDNWCDMQQMHNMKLSTPFRAWKGLFQHLEGSPMDEYHEFRRAHEILINEWRLYRSPNYVSIIRGIVAPSGATTTLNISLASGSATSSGTTKGGGVGASTSTWAHCMYLTQLWNSSVSYEKL